MECSVYLRHGLVGMFVEHLRVLHSLDFVKQLRTERNVEILENAVGNVLARLTFAAAFCFLVVLLIFLNNILNGYLSGQVDELVLRVDGVPIIDEIGFEVFRNSDSDFSFYYLLISFV